MERKYLKKIKIPDVPGVYMFRGKRNNILYIGKATSLKNRVRSYFSKDIVNTRGARIKGMIDDAESITWEETNSVLEALILEANLIKKHKPIFNVKEKDNKSFNYLTITKEGFPRVLVVRGRDLEKNWAKEDIKKVFGPFTESASLKSALKLVRKIFPFRSECRLPEATGKRLPSPCFNNQIGFCPGVCVGAVTQKEYAKTIRNVSLLFSGKKESLIERLEKDMKSEAQKEDFERATVLRNQINALKHIQDVSLIKRKIERYNKKDFRIESYDIAHTSGTNVVGVMAVIINGQPVQSEYRTFNVRTAKNNDVKALLEIVSRRLGHTEWQIPQLIVVDGGAQQISAVNRMLLKYGIEKPVVGVVKDRKHKPREILCDDVFTGKYNRDILLANSEAHRFALSRHKNKRDKL